MHSGEHCGIAAVSTADTQPSFILTAPCHMSLGTGGVGGAWGGVAQRIVTRLLFTSRVLTAQSVSEDGRWRK